MNRKGRTAVKRRSILRVAAAWIFGAALTGPAWGAAVSGKTIATHGIRGIVPACSSCHGTPGGGGENGAFPRLAGLSAPYIQAQLRAFRSGHRQSTIMEGVAEKLNDADIYAIAAYYSGKTAPYPPRPNEKSASLRAGQRLVAYGDDTQGVPACQACHGSTLMGGGPSIPRLSGQWYPYLIRQLDAFRDDRRPGTTLQLMARITRKMTPSEIRDSASYIASLRKGQRVGMPHITRTRWKPRTQSPDKFVPPPESAMPVAGPNGAMIALGEKIFTNTPTYASRYVGNRLSCGSCHLDRGRSPTSAPVWAAVPIFPMYRKKNGKVNTLQMRIQGCFLYSENGKAPPADGRTLIALISYMHWLATGLPTGIKSKAAGYPKLAKPIHGFDRLRGQAVYASHCAICHGGNGQGRMVDGDAVFPPLWGPESFNWGAGMHSVAKAAAFIKYNMPFSDANSLSDQQAWDVAAWVDSNPRPQDPRFDGSINTTERRFHKHHKYDYYGRKVDGLRLGAPGTLKTWRLRH